MSFPRTLNCNQFKMDHGNHNHNTHYSLLSTDENAMENDVQNMAKIKRNLRKPNSVISIWILVGALHFVASLSAQFKSFACHKSTPFLSTICCCCCFSTMCAQHIRHMCALFNIYERLLTARLLFFGFDRWWHVTDKRQLVKNRSHPSIRQNCVCDEITLFNHFWSVVNSVNYRPKDDSFTLINASALQHI